MKTAANYAIHYYIIKNADTVSYFIIKDFAILFIMCIFEQN